MKAFVPNGEPCWDSMVQEFVKGRVVFLFEWDIV
jgi:hypothetical protein